MTARWWARWVASCLAPTDARVLAAVRIALCLVLALDILDVLRLGLVDSLLGDDAWPVVVGLLGALALAGLGVLPGPALVAAVVASAWLGAHFPAGDRAIDRLLRTAMLVVALGGSASRWSLVGRRRDAIPAWPTMLLAFLVALACLDAGVARLMDDPGWLGGRGEPAMYRLACDPLIGRLDPVAWQHRMPLFRVGGWLLVAFELGAPLLLTRWSRWWALFGVAVHLAAALVTDAGLMAWGMLALYPVFLAPWVLGQAGAAATTSEPATPPRDRAG